jgi:hypothetical protein
LRSFGLRVIFLSNWGWYDHPFQNHFKSHGMAAAPAGLKKVTITSPLPILVLYSVRVVRAIKCYGKTAKMNPIPLFGVALGFLNFANHARVHGLRSPFNHCERMQKSTRYHACLSTLISM